MVPMENFFGTRPDTSAVENSKQYLRHQAGNESEDLLFGDT